MGREERRCKSDWRTFWSVYVDPHQSIFLTTVEGHGEFHVLIAFDHRGNEQDLGVSLWDSRMDEKGTISLTSGSGPCDTNVSLSLSQAELLNYPEFARKVKGLEGMLRVRERLCETDRVSVQVRNSAWEGGGRDAGAVAPGAASAGVQGSRVPLLRSNSGGGSVGCALDVVASSAGECGGQDPRADVRDDIVGVRSSTAGESNGIVDLHEVHESDFSVNSTDA